MNTVFGELVSVDGLAYDRARPTQRYWSSPAAEYARNQGWPIPVTAEHGGRVCGEVVHLERNAPAVSSRLRTLTMTWPRL